MREREREKGRDMVGHRQTEKQAPCRKPHMGFNPGSPGSCPGPKAGTKPLRHPGIPLPGLNSRKGCAFLKQVVSLVLSTSTSSI